MENDEGLVARFLGNPFAPIIAVFLLCIVWFGLGEVVHQFGISFVTYATISIPAAVILLLFGASAFMILETLKIMKVRPLNTNEIVYIIMIIGFWIFLTFGICVMFGIIK
jgi:hypothetical protein